MCDIREKPPAAPFTIEPVSPRHVGEISRSLAAMDPWLTLGYKPEAVSFYLLKADPSLKRHSIVVSGRVSGVLAVRFPWLFGPFIELIALFGGCRRKGIGSALIGRTCEQYPASPNLWATVSSFNIEAQRFYERVGFEKSCILEDLIMPGRDEILLRKRLSPDS